ncbi:hypothetical protein GXW78_23850 [Roseomonas terrae]|jgi:hypothetical protein|uniref:Oxidoreductase molybdopterin-binding domain-containing protein n=1 Tax=Neoroseomonas terrae TaxID=424799 RepID=A0ABS5ENV1_9PROT|nr:hypothetical protein [Neoroseomonas terrae]MBR0652712.1 hypothetical protein [Neoroseomonas terrae]
MPVARRTILAGAALPRVALASGEPCLEIGGAIAPPAPRRLTLSEIEALGAADLRTRTPWTVGPQHFSGLPLRRLLDAVESRGNLITASALNDYAFTSPIQELLDSDAFLATRLDGTPVPVRLRGPFWIVFPWSRRPELETPTNRRRAVWQLSRLEIH